MHVGSNPFEGVYRGRDHVTAGAADQRKAGVLVNIGTDSGVNAHGTDVCTVAAVTGDQINFLYLTGEHRIQVPEKIRVRAKHAAEIISRTGGKGTDCDIRMPRRTTDTFIEGAVSAAGVDAEFLIGGFGFSNNLFCGVLWPTCDIDLEAVLPCTEGPFNAART